MSIKADDLGDRSQEWLDVEERAMQKRRRDRAAAEQKETEMHRQLEEQRRLLAEQHAEQLRKEEAEAEARGPEPAPVPCPECQAPQRHTADGESWLPPDEGPCPECQQRTAEIEREAEARRYRIAALCLSELESGWTLEAYRPRTPSGQEALAAANGESSLWLYGPPGTGKTHLVTGAAIRTLEAGSARVERWLVSNLLRTLQEASRAGNGLEERIIRSLSECDLLLLDDLDLDRTSGFRRELLHEIADARWRNGRRTLVTSNKPPHEIAEGVGERVTSRLAGLCRVLHLEGPDGRRSRKESDAA